MLQNQYSSKVVEDLKSIRLEQHIRLGKDIGCTLLLQSHALSTLRN
jgi:hypothetical protein